jgi:two-component system chemotaxis response regulator CheV
VRARLEEAGHFAVHSVGNGEEAWNHLLSLREKALAEGVALTELVDVVLTDIEMPGMDGYHLCKRIKESPEFKDIPVILFSSLITDKLIHKGQSVGADGQFSKPDLSLLSFMKDLVEKKQKAA